jgi:hypothetical protein
MLQFRVQEDEMQKTLEVPTWDTDSRRSLERQGYVIESGTLQNWFMRLDFPEGISELVSGSDDPVV